jgi:hypothetical protein
MQISNRPLKTLRLPFDKLRVNGTGIKIIVSYPFVVSLSIQFSYDFFHVLL